MSEFLFNDLEGTASLSGPALKQLQCNILSSTGRAVCDHVFHRFLSKEAFLKWLEQAPTPSAAGETGPDLVNILLTYEALKRLGVSEGLLDQMDPAFRRGTRNPHAYKKLGDPVAIKWESDHRSSWHAVELHWRSDQNQKRVSLASTGPEHKLVLEYGNALGQDGKPLTKDGTPHYNHFGIRDGGTNTVFTQQDHEALLAKREAQLAKDANAGDKTWKWDPRQKLSTLLVPDPFAGRLDAYGSYFVFRKYSQDVPKFRQDLSALAKTIAELKGGNGLGWPWDQYELLKDPNLTTEDFLQLSETLKSANRSLNDALSCRAGVVLTQLIFGIGPNGQRPAGGAENDFNYEGDPEGKKCPFAAHARACNARGSRRAPQFERKTMITRRGISHETGTYFWCAQASIGEQFEYIQEKWANSANVNPDHQPTPGVDYLIGQASPDPDSVLADVMKFTLDIQDTIKLLASEYLFAPSIPTFQRLQKGDVP